LKPRKLRTLAELGKIVDVEKRRGRRIVLANGCFDLLHIGHVRYLRGAAAKGDILVVALNSDASVRALKGPGRPFMLQSERAEILSAIECVDYVTIFPERNVEKVLRALRPNVHAKGSDYTVNTVPERETVKALGGTVHIAGGPKVRSTRDIVKLVAGRKETCG
jgi:rfaE bifunctional protein nucleotidyltransferase chain/domain